MLREIRYESNLMQFSYILQGRRNEFKRDSTGWSEWGRGSTEICLFPLSIVSFCSAFGMCKNGKL